jgi:hypothetical protein
VDASRGDYGDDSIAQGFVGRFSAPANKKNKNRANYHRQWRAQTAMQGVVGDVYVVRMGRRGETVRAHVQETPYIVVRQHAFPDSAKN